MITQILLRVSLPLVLASQAATAEWKTFAPQGGGFAMSFPGEPAEHKEKVQSPAGMLAITYFVVELHGTTYACSRARYPGGATKGDSQKRRLDNARDGAVASAKGKLETEKPIKLGSFDGRELLIRGDKSWVRTRIYAVQNRLFQTMVFGSKEAVGGKDADQFLDSFKLVE
jgi:hypothetical protein